MVVLFLVSLEPPLCFPQWLHQSVWLPTVCKGLLFPPPSPTPVSCCFYVNSHPSWCEVVSHSGFILHFLMVNGVAPFHYLLVIFCHLWQNVHSSLCSGLDWVVCFLAIELCKFCFFFLNKSWVLTLCQTYGLQIFFPTCRLPFHFVDSFLCSAEPFCLM